MAFVPIFAISTPIPIDPTAIILQDNSTGTDAAIASRQVLIYQSSGVLLTPAIPWPLATNPITINPLIQDISVNIVVNWLNAGGSVIYNYSQIYAFTANGELFFYRLTEAQSSTPSITQDQNYYANKGILRVELDSAQQAITIGQDVASSQQCINRYYQLINNSSNYF